ncbi:MAG: hypothetical protein AAGC92_02575 [Pseudomonadota bacterium]
MRGGKGDDAMLAAFGKSRMTGGDGVDVFLIDNGFRGLSGRAQRAGQNARGVVQDFDGSVDLHPLATVDSAMSFGDASVSTSLETLSGIGTRAIPADFSLNSVSSMVRETGSGHARIRHVGKDGKSRSDDGALIGSGQSLASIEPAEVVSMGYAADAFALFRPSGPLA